MLEGEQRVFLVFGSTDSIVMSMSHITDDDDDSDPHKKELASKKKKLTQTEKYHR